MRRFGGVTVAVIFLFLGCSSPENDELTANSKDIGQANVTFYGVGKVARYQQHADSSLEALGPVFFAEIFIAASGEVKDAQVKVPAPAGSTRQLQYRYSESEEIGDVMYLSRAADTDEDLEREFPSGAYQFTFSTPAGDVDGSVVSFEGGAYPTQPVIILKQAGTQIGIEQVDPELELVVTWPPFEQGDADQNGILDDLIFVSIDSCRVEDIVHSGRPYEKSDYLTFRAAEYRIPAATFEPGQTYSMYVEHALLPHTQVDFGMPAFATFAASTYMDFQTIGKSDPHYCEDFAQ